MPHRFIQARPGFEANGVEVQLHVDVRMRQKAGTHADHENKIREILCRGPSAKIYTLEIYPLYGIQLHVYSKPQPSLVYNCIVNHSSALVGSLVQ